MIFTDNGRNDAQGLSEIVVLGSGFSTDYTIIHIHKDIGTYLQLGHTVEIRVNIVGSRTATRHDFQWNTLFNKFKIGLNGSGHHPFGMCLSFFKSCYMRRSTRIGMDSAQPEVLQPGYATGKLLCRVAGSYTGTASDRVDINENIQINIFSNCCLTELLCVIRMVDDRHRIRLFPGYFDESADFVAANHFGSNQQTADAAFGKCFSLADGSGTYAKGSGFNLASGNLDAFVGFAMGTKVNGNILSITTHFVEVCFKYIKIENQTGGCKILPGQTLRTHAVCKTFVNLISGITGFKSMYPYMRK